MPVYMTPGVYVEEVASQSKPIEGVGTSVASFVGIAPGGPVNTPMRVSNWTEFSRIYSDPKHPENGPFMDGAFLAHSVYGFFQNGGGLAWIVRVAVEGAEERPQAALPAATNSEVEALRAIAKEGVTGDITVEIVAETPGTRDESPEKRSKDDTPDDVASPAPEPLYRIVVTAGDEREEFEGLSTTKGRNNIATKVNAQSKLVVIAETGASLPAEQQAPLAGSYTLATPEPTSTPVTAREFEGDVARRQGMGGLAGIDEITMVVMPDLWTILNGDDTQVRDLQGKMISHCEQMGDRMALIDSPPNLLPQDVQKWRMDAAGYDSKFAALYYPWVEVMDQVTRKPILIPPSGHVAGTWARVDSTRGVHKAPANEVLKGVNGLGFQVTHEEQGELNRRGVNCIRSFPGRGIRIWGARTMSSDPEWRYINVRRLFNFVAESIIEGTQWAVFEPNDRHLWTRLRIASENFLTRIWRDGALFGARPEEAFFVKCDAETNPPDVVEAGQVVIEIGISPVKPAEFVVFRISQFTAGAAEITA